MSIKSAEFKDKSWSIKTKGRDRDVEVSATNGKWF